MAYSTLKSGAATHDGVTFGYLLKIRVIGRQGGGSQSGHPSTRQRI